MKLTVPANPFTELIVIVEVPEPPARIVEGVTTLAVMVNSGTTTTWYVMMAVEWDKVPLVPLTVTVKSPVLDEPQDRVEWPEPVTEVGVLQVRPVDRETVKETVSENPFWAVMVMGVGQLFPVLQETVSAVVGSIVKSTT